MKFTLFSKENQLDEMQEQILRQIEAKGFWFLWGGLFLAIMVQIIAQAPVQQYAGEFIVFQASCVYVAIKCLRNGLWNRHLNASTPVNALISLFAGVVVIVVTGLSNGYWLFALIPGVITGTLCFVLLQLCMVSVKKRRRELDNPKDEEK